MEKMSTLIYAEELWRAYQRAGTWLQMSASDSSSREVRAEYAQVLGGGVLTAE